jgi:hypothetical protein
MKKKKMLMIFGIVCACVVVLCTIFALVFRLKTVDVEFRTRINQTETNLPSNIQAKVLEDGDFGYGKNILFMNVENNIASIEKYNPYVKVEQVIRYFPNVLRVYISERIPRFRVRDTNDDDRWYILDSEFKVLDKVTTSEITTKVVSGASNYYKKTIEIDASSLTVSSYIGEFINETVYKSYLNDIVTGIFGKANDISVAKRISVIRSDDGTYKFEIIMKNENSQDDDEGGKIVLWGATNLTQKANRGVSCYFDYILDNPDNDPTQAIISVEEKNNRYEVTVTNENGTVSD